MPRRVAEDATGELPKLPMLPFGCGKTKGSQRCSEPGQGCATLLLRQGVNPKFVQELLGHADISLTLNVYSHVLPDMGDAAAGRDGRRDWIAW